MNGDKVERFQKSPQPEGMVNWSFGLSLLKELVDWREEWGICKCRLVGIR